MQKKSLFTHAIIAIVYIIMLMPNGAFCQNLVALDTANLKTYVSRFAEEDRWYFQVATDAAVSTVFNGVYGGQYVKNADAYGFLKSIIPYFDAPDTNFIRNYYYRWWTFRKHIKNIGTANAPNFIITEFINKEGWADATNSIIDATGHHLYEGRWLKDPVYTENYARYWFTSADANTRRYSAWLADGVLASVKVHPNNSLVTEMLTSTKNRLNFETNWQGWIKASNAPGNTKQVAYFDTKNGLFWQNTDRDAMENSLCGNGQKPSINAYLYGDARAIAQMFTIAAISSPANATAYTQKSNSYNATADTLRKHFLDNLWSPSKNFFMTNVLNGSSYSLCNKREQVGFTPWYFNLVPDGGAIDYDKAWDKTLTSSSVFQSVYGITSGGQNETGFNPGNDNWCCRWDGPIWPFATSITLKGMTNLIRNHKQSYLTKTDFYNVLKTYAMSHQSSQTRGGKTRTISWLDECMSPTTGRWDDLLKNNDSNKPRGYSYNHSSFNDIIISDLMGICPRTDDTLEINPLIQGTPWDYCAIDNVNYHGRTCAIVWDKTGTHYNKGKGFLIFIDKKEVFRSDTVVSAKIWLNATTLVNAQSQVNVDENNQFKVHQTMSSFCITFTKNTTAHITLYQPNGKKAFQTNVINQRSVFIPQKQISTGVWIVKSKEGDRVVSKTVLAW